MTVHLIAHWLGLDNGSGPVYLAWSGFGGDISQLAIIGAVVAVVRHRNCEVKGCWRMGRHQTAAGHRVCRRHHPDGAPTHRDVIDAHEARKGGLPG